MAMLNKQMVYKMIILIMINILEFFLDNLRLSKSMRICSPTSHIPQSCVHSVIDFPLKEDHRNLPQP
jgi:hypothetical protein